MKKKFIPIIGTISAGKSTFLQGLLGTSVLEAGSTTTTKFVCLIKNSEQTLFYHVIPKKEKDIEFIKEGMEIFEEEKIKKKIQEINKTLSEKPGSKDDIFYMLEIPIKNIENVPLLEECYFMDIPGLNENKSSYIEIIFSLLTLDDIKFEIMVFDSTCIGSDNILNIIKKLEEKKCLKKSDNLFVLNRIDQTTKNGEEEIINSFKQYFYQNFEDDKLENLIQININENKFVPMNSLLYLAETKINQDYSSMLIVEFFSYIESKDKGNFSSFYEYLEKKLEFNLNWIKDQGKSINLDVKSISKEEFGIIEKSVEEINKIKKFSSNDCLVDIKLKKKDVKNNMIKLFLIHKNKCYFYVHSKYYDQLQQIMKEINIKDNNDLSSPPSALNNNFINLYAQQHENQNIIINNINNNKNNNDLIDIPTLNELEKFLSDTFKKIDPNNELDSFNHSLQSLRESLLGRKIRIAFIGNISVGKSSVLNSIIGEDILPTNDKECTYRGIIIRHKEGESFKLYKTKLETRGKGNDEYYYFIDDEKPYCRNIKEIKSYLTVKNNDKQIEDKDAYLVITGYLKIFDFIKLDKDVISKIEFIDLPGPDRENNVFNEKKYYKKILKFSNCCVYINEPKTIDDENSVKMMVNQYEKDKQKIFPKLRANFIKTCVFLINKSDTIVEKTERLKLESKIFNNISTVEENLDPKDINISFFSGKYFLKYLDIILYFVDYLENNQFILIYSLFNEYNSKISSYWKNFKTFVLNKIKKIEENFFLDEDDTENEEEEDEEEPPEDFTKNMKIAFEQLEKIRYKLLEVNDCNEIIQKLYNLNKKLKKKDFSNTYYSAQFFNDLKKAIENSVQLNKENLKNYVQDFFKDTDILFKKELKKETEDKKIEKKKELNELKNYKNIIKDIFEKTRENIKKIFNNGKERILGQIDGEISNISERLKESDKDLDIAKDKLQTKINNIIEEIKKDQKELFSKLAEEIKKEIEKKAKEKDININSTNIDTNKGFTVKMIVSAVFSTIAGVAVRTGLAFIGGAAAASAAGAATGAAVAGATVGGVSSTLAASGAIGALGGPVGIAVGVAVGLGISVTTLLVHVFSKEKRYETGLRDFRIKIETDLNESENNALEDFKTFEEDFMIAIQQKFSALQMEIVNVDKEQWEDLKKKYAIQKNNMLKKFCALE